MTRWLTCIGWVLAMIAAPAMAADYPRTVVDLAGRRVTLKAAPQRIVMQDSNDLLLLALLEREDPLARVAAWNNAMLGSDPSLWQQVVERWPSARAVKSVGFSTGQLDIEGILRTRPDLIIARIDMRPAIENTVMYSVLKRLGIPLLYVDTEADPLVNVPRSVELLGEALGQQERAAQYVADYRQRLTVLQQRTKKLPSRRVFVEVRAGQAGNFECCHTQGKTGWGLMVEALGAVNIGTQYLRGRSGGVALETLIRSKPDVYLMTGTQRVRNGISAIPFGYAIDPALVAQQMRTLMQRTGFASVARDPQSCVAGIHHQFYNSVFNVIGLEHLAKAIWPEAFTDLDPDADYRQILARFTTLPTQAPFVFAGRECFAVRK